ncbi:MAG: hypothetical protein OEY24_02340 [Candidatus Bathyarchaeota archaeon]|nr:hypothetical protein [Candidatus Bathyarchaeota archaeon]
MVIYVVYLASKNIKDRSLTPRRLHALGCRKIHKCFWEINEKNLSKVTQLLQGKQPVLLKKAREIRRPLSVRTLKEKKFRELGSLVIVIHNIDKETKREKASHFLKKAPYIRLRRSVYAFLQRHSLFDKKNELVDWQKFVTFLRENGEDFKVITRVVILNQSCIVRLLEETKQRVEAELLNIAESCKRFQVKFSKEGCDPQFAKDALSKLKRRFTIIKNVASFYEKWMEVDFSKSLMKSYRAIKKMQSFIDSNRANANVYLELVVS